MTKIFTTEMSGTFVRESDENSTMAVAMEGTPPPSASLSVTALSDASQLLSAEKLLVGALDTVDRERKTGRKEELPAASWCLSQ